MNEEMIFEMIGCIDDKYVLEAAPKLLVNSHIRRRIITALIAAVIAISLLTVGAAAAYYFMSHREGVRQFYTESGTQALESGGYMIGELSENEHFRITLDSFISDDYRAFPIITVETLDAEAVKYLQQNLLLEGVLTYADTGETAAEYISFLGTNEYKNNIPLTIRGSILFHYGSNNIDRNRQLIMSFRTAEYDLNGEKNDNDDLLEGISFALPRAVCLRNIRLFSEDGTEAYVSEIGLAAMVPAENIENWQYQIKWKDGSISDPWHKYLGGEGTGLYLDGEDNGVLINFMSLIDPDKIETLTLGGVEFKRR